MPSPSSGSSCTIVLCGARTHERKYVDWEINATLDNYRLLAEGDLPADSDPGDLARYVVTLMHGMAFEAAGGASRGENHPDVPKCR